MAVRNFWIDADIDKRETLLSGGPRARDGGMRLTIKQRDKGKITTAFVISSREVNGKLITEVYDSKNNLVQSNVTER